MSNNTPSADITEIFNVQQHRALRFHIEQGFGFARQVPLVDVSLQDALTTSLRLPIVFRRDKQGHLYLCQLLHLGTISAISATGRWQVGGVIPALLRLYPFGFVSTATGHSLTLRPKAPHFQGPGQVLVTSKGKPTRLMRTIMQHIATIKNEFTVTRQLLEELNKAGVLKRLYLNSQHIPVEIVDPAASWLKFSPALQRLLQRHADSLKRHNLPTPASEPSANPAQALCIRFCHQHQVELSELKSRKRQAQLMRLRQYLAAEALHHGCLEQMAELLERSPATLKSWLQRKQR